MEIGIAVGAGILMGLMPAGNALWVLLFAFFFILRIHLPSLILSAAIVKLAAPALDPLLHSLGSTVLKAPILEQPFASFYNTPLVPFTHYNSTTVMGSLISGLVLLIPAALLFSLLVRLYRKTLLPKIRNSKFVKNLKRIPIVSRIIQAMADTSSGISGH